MDATFYSILPSEFFFFFFVLFYFHGMDCQLLLTYLFSILFRFLQSQFSLFLSQKERKHPSGGLVGWLWIDMVNILADRDLPPCKTASSLEPANITKWHVRQANTQIGLRILRLLGKHRSKASSSIQQRLWSDCADAQAHLSLLWAHILFDMFCCVPAEILVKHTSSLIYRCPDAVASAWPFELVGCYRQQSSDLRCWSYLTHLLTSTHDTQFIVAGQEPTSACMNTW